MFGFLVAPKSSRTKKKNENPENPAENEKKKKKSGFFGKKQKNPDSSDEEIYSDSPVLPNYGSNYSKKNQPSDNDETVIGTLDL